MEQKINAMKGAASTKMALAHLGAPTPLDVERRSVLVLDITPAATQEVLQAHFSPCGAILRVTLLREKATQAFSGAAYIEFAEPVAAARALALNSSPLLGKTIRVRPKPPRRGPPPGMAAAGWQGGAGQWIAAWNAAPGMWAVPGAAAGASTMRRAPQTEAGLDSAPASGGGSQRQSGASVESQPSSQPKKLSEAGPLKSGSMTWKRSSVDPDKDALQPPLVRPRLTTEPPS
ncbi:hypothetical protein V8C86DRAFT_505434 [Haematococcus lacustris]